MQKQLLSIQVGDGEERPKNIAAELPNDPAREVLPIATVDTDSNGDLKNGAAVRLVQEVIVDGITEFQHWQSVPKV